MTRWVSMVEAGGAQVQGRPRLGWTDSRVGAIGSRGMTVEAACGTMHG